MTDDDWVVPEDDYEPFDEWMVIEFSYQIFATRDEAERFAAALHDVIAPIVGSVGRCQTGRIELTSAANGQHDEQHSASRRRRQPGQSLYDVEFAVRGRGDSNWLSHSIFHAVHAARLDWEQMTEGLRQGADLAAALQKYPQLAIGVGEANDHSPSDDDPTVNPPRYL
ncbi:hypothetical protein [Gordonia sp. KTR9]|uniref:hypothetical protein n=1 Tax=Gordonia sp. KTR9 TaxID=337191 RepID=UPI00027DE6C9|nr:hypothetical protein [Gordonia sp. KTR9]AFR51567.1 hypothetical protein KTR9_5354 [Gordonia sp. KTR9]